MSNNILTSPSSANVRENYSSLDGLRAYAAVGIVLMHVLANLVVKPSDNILTCNVIPWFTNFTLLCISPLQRKVLTH